MAATSRSNVMVLGKQGPAGRAWCSAVHTAAALSVTLLIAVASSKTLLTKATFKRAEFDYPVLLSALSCVVTDVCIIILWGTGAVSFSVPPRGRVGMFVIVTLFTAAGMAFQNLALSSLSVAVQQALRATMPVFVIMFERILLSRTHNIWVYASLVPLLTGPLVLCFGSTGGDTALLGLIYMSLGVLASAIKVVYLYKTIKSVEQRMGMVSFLFWLDLFMLAVLAPWAVANGETSRAAGWRHRGSGVAWTVVLFVCLMGGLRAYSINLVVKYASALTKTVADICSQALTIYLSLFLFGTRASPMLHAGIAITLAGCILYAFVKMQVKAARRQSSAGASKFDASAQKSDGEEVEPLLDQSHTTDKKNTCLAV